MITFNELTEKINNNEIPKEEWANYLDKSKLGIAGIVIFKLIKERYCNEEIIERLVDFSKLLHGYKFLGPWQYGHVAIATLLLVQDEEAMKRYLEICEELNANDKFLVTNFIESEVYKD